MHTQVAFFSFCPLDSVCFTYPTCDHVTWDFALCLFVAGKLVRWLGVERTHTWCSSNFTRFVIFFWMETTWISLYVHCFRTFWFLTVRSNCWKFKILSFLKYYAIPTSWSASVQVTYMSTRMLAALFRVSTVPTSSATLTPVPTYTPILGCFRQEQSFIFLFCWQRAFYYFGEWFGSHLVESQFRHEIKRVGNHHNTREVISHRVCIIRSFNDCIIFVISITWRYQAITL